MCRDDASVLVAQEMIFVAQEWILAKNNLFKRYAHSAGPGMMQSGRSYFACPMIICLAGARCLGLARPRGDDFWTKMGAKNNSKMQPNIFKKLMNEFSAPKWSQNYCQNLFQNGLNFSMIFWGFWGTKMNPKWLWKGCQIRSFFGVFSGTFSACFLVDPLGRQNHHFGALA